MKRRWPEILDTALRDQLGPGTVITPPSACPECGKILNGSDALDDQLEPEPGDLCVCAQCAALAGYGPNLELMAVTPAQVAALTPDQRRGIEELQALIRARQELGALGKTGEA